MKNFLSAEDIEAVAERGQTELIVGKDDVLTDVARRTAETLGVRLMESVAGGVTSAASAAPSFPQSQARPQFSGRPKGCLTKPGFQASKPAPAGGSSSQLVDQLVQALKTRAPQTAARRP